jgi:hypothetical protein
MRIIATFIKAPGAVVPALVASWTIAALLACACAWLVADTLELRSQLPLTARRLGILQRQSTAAPKTPLPSQAQLSGMRDRVHAINNLSGARGWTTAQLLSWLEHNLPREVHLVALHHKAKEGEALLTAEAANAAALTGFLAGLEKEPAFSEVLLSKQSTHTAEGSTPAVQFEIKLRLRS